MISKKQTKLEKLKIWMKVFGDKKHTHDRENARRRRQIEREIIRVTV